MKNLFEINNNNNNKCDGKHCSSVLSGKLEKESNRDRRCMKKREKNAPSEVEMCKIIHGKCQYSTQCVHTPNSFLLHLAMVNQCIVYFGLAACHLITIVNVPKRVSIRVKIRLHSFAVR